MKSKIVASVEFYYKGEKFIPSATIELFKYMDSKGQIPSLHMLLAQENGIDLYSYEYEIMLLENIRCTQAEGLATLCITNGEFDVEIFQGKWQEAKCHDILQSIVRRTMNIDNLDEHPELKCALIEAYQVGKNER
ncbi:MAG TPA: hypothetical protein ENI64_03580 [Gammaproteobacteria bacterium]|nr:hypothetical protein [Gammaproteobacteria bacterium]